MTFRQKLIPILALVLLTAIGVTIWDGQRRLGERVLGQQTLLDSSASESAVLTPSASTTTNASARSEAYVSLLQTLDDAVYHLHLTQTTPTMITSDYRVVVAGEWTVVTPQTLVIENSGARDEVTLSSEQQTSYTHYQLQAGGEVLARTYTQHDGQWQESTRTITCAQQDLTYSHLWSVAHSPVADQPERLTAAALDGGTYHFYFTNDSLAKVELISDNGHTRLEYHRTDELPEIHLPDDLQTFIETQE